MSIKGARLKYFYFCLLMPRRHLIHLDGKPLHIVHSADTTANLDSFQSLGNSLFYIKAKARPASGGNRYRTEGLESNETPAHDAG